MSQFQLRPALAAAIALVLCPAGLARAESAGAHPAAAIDETLPSEAALRAIDEHWGRAESDGDVAYLSQLLAPEYRSVGPRGEVTSRAALLEHTTRRAGSAEARAEAHRSAEAYRQAHPTELSIVLHGTLGIVSYFDPTRGAEHSVRGADVFVYEGRRWHAVYSLHNAAE
jgi:hypothetical protein